MNKSYFISIFHDTRRSKNNNLFPVKIRVFDSNTKKAKFYPTVFDLSEGDFEKLWSSQKPRGELKEVKDKLVALESVANAYAESLRAFTFPDFEKKLLNKPNDTNNVFSCIDQAVTNFRSNGQVNTANTYDLAKRSFIEFLKSSTGGEKKLSFYDVNADWLNKYEKYMVNVKGRSLTTVSMYLRTLRTVFNSAIADRVIDAEYYPFGKKKYKVPAGRNIKKALSHDELKVLFNCKPGTLEQEKARDFWFFSYSCNGANIKDIVNLKYSNIDKKQIYFYRAKTINTSKGDSKPISIYITDFAQSVLKKYGNKKKDLNEYVFPVINFKMNEEQKHRATKNFTKFINQNLKKLAKMYGITTDISTYYARHSYATNAVLNGASMEYVQEALGHSDTKTTINYFKGFEDKDKKGLMEKLMDF